MNDKEVYFSNFSNECRKKSYFLLCMCLHEVFMLLQINEGKMKCPPLVCFLEGYLARGRSLRFLVEIPSSTRDLEILLFLFDNRYFEVCDLKWTNKLLKKYVVSNDVKNILLDWPGKNKFIILSKCEKNSRSVVKHCKTRNLSSPLTHTSRFGVCFFSSSFFLYATLYEWW